MKKGAAAGGGDTRKKGRKEKNVDMEKLADGLQKLTEDDLLHVVQLVHDNKTAETYTKNDVDSKLIFFLLHSGFAIEVLERHV